MKRSPHFTRAATLILALVCVACSDPGTGGTGVPGAELGADGGLGTGVSAPAAPPAATAPGVDSNACAADSNADARVLVGRIEARTGACLRVDGRRFDIGATRIEFANGIPGSESDLQVGQRVTITPVAGEPSKAATVIIEIG